MLSVCSPIFGVTRGNSDDGETHIKKNYYYLFMNKDIYIYIYIEIKKQINIRSLFFIVISLRELDTAEIVSICVFYGSAHYL